MTYTKLANNLTPEEQKKIQTKGNVIIDHTLLTDTLLMEDDEVGKLMRSIAEYVILGVVPSFTKSERIAEMAFTRFKVSNDAYNEKYIESCRLKSKRKKEEWAERKKKE